MTALRTYQERVRKSALRLDKEIPNWERKVSIKNLNMSFTGYPGESGCICGQLGIADGERQYDESQGFDSYNLLIGGRDRYAVLKRLWVHQILLRRKADYARRKAGRVVFSGIKGK